MARRSIVQYFDDLDDTPLAPHEVNQIHFTINGTDYVLEVSSANQKRFYDTVQPFVDKARRETRGRRGARSANPGLTQGIPTYKIREWAADEGIELAPRGRLPQEVVRQYQQAHDLV